MNPSQSPVPRKRSRKIVNNQKEFLVNFMLEHPDLALSQNKTSHSRNHTATLWRQLKDELNKLGPSKNITQYKTVWKEIKSKSKKKHLSIMRLSRHKTVKDVEHDYITDSDDKKHLNDIDNKVISLMHQASETDYLMEDTDVSVEEEDTLLKGESLETSRSPSHETDPKGDNNTNISDLSKSLNNLCSVLKNRNEIIKRKNRIEEERNDILRSALTLFGTLVHNFGVGNQNGSTT